MHGKASVSKKIAGSQTLRTVFSLLFVLNTVLLASNLLSFWFLHEYGFYSGSFLLFQENKDDGTGGEAYRNEAFKELMAESSRKAKLLYLYSLNQGVEMLNDNPDDTLDNLKKELLQKDRNFIFVFRDDQNDDYAPNDYAFTNLEFKDYDDLNRLLKDTSFEFDYYPSAEEIFDKGEYAPLFRNRSNSLTYEAHLKKGLPAHDEYWRASRFFSNLNRYMNELKLKYAVLALMILLAVFEVVLFFVLYSVSGNRALTRERDLDRIPLYLLLPFYAMFGSLCILLLRRQAAVLSDLPTVFSGEDLKPTFYMIFLLLFALAALLQMLVSTVSARVHRPMWWRRSILYRTFAARSFGQRVRTVLSIFVALEFAVFFIVYLCYGPIPPWLYFAADGVFTLTMAVLLYIVYRDMSVYIPRTRRIAAQQSGFVPTEGLSDSGKTHAENINFLSRSASAETERRFINESFSAELIHSVSNGLREPLNDVAENVRLLESGTLTDEQERACTERIVSLSQDLKKTIEDMILISKASTGNLPLEAVPTDAGMMLSQAVGEFDARFAEAEVQPVVEQPGEPVLIRADGQFMWYVFEGILSVMLENAVPGTRLFLRAGREGDNAVIVFRCTLRPEARLQSRDLSGMGLSSAKVFTMMQGGVMVDHLSHDTLMAVLQFPAIPSDESE